VRARFFALIVGSTVYVACGASNHAQAPPESAPPPAPEPLAGSAGAPEKPRVVQTESPIASPDVAGTWIGYYRCGQGKTGLSLTIEHDSDDVLHGKFEFFPIPENPTVSTGTFAMKGSYSGRRVVLAGGEWIHRPPNYDTVGLSGELSEDGTSFDGRVTHPVCSDFSLRRSHASAPGE
jgi:hypothetical protein